MLTAAYREMPHAYEWKNRSKLAESSAAAVRKINLVRVLEWQLMVEVRETGENTVDGVRVDEEVQILFGGKPFITTFVHHRNQFIEVVIDVKECDGFLVDVDLAPRQHGREFFKGAEASGENNEGIGLPQHFVLAFIHGRRLDKGGHVFLG